ncbi:penicillin acylase family protein [Marinobacter salarius]|uniref:penicillin acylase family protein n=1 Tax=Marinobacter salarius TaxID=1420917 RepID=UPI0032EDF07B
MKECLCSLKVMFVVVSILIPLTGCGLLPGVNDNSSNFAEVEVAWDQWGVPHISTDNVEAADFAFGWSQMAGRANTILRLYGEARGRAAEYWGPEHVESDVFIRTMGVYERAQRMLAAQGPVYARRLEAFAAGMNAYAEVHPEDIDAEMRQVLRVTAVDVLAHLQRSLHLSFVLRDNQAVARSWTADAGEAGSNAWAIGPGRSESGNAMLLINPHLHWQDMFLFYEAQITVPGYNMYGAALLGWPFMALGFNEYLGWAHTVNLYDGADVYELDLRDGGYVLDNVVREFEQRVDTLKIRQQDGTLETRDVTILTSIHGPVVRMNGSKALALRVAGIQEGDTAQIFRQYWRMGGAQTLDEFEVALSELQMPMFNVVYADRHGDIFFAFNALQPKRDTGDVAFWRGIVDGTKSDLIWTDYRTYGELPKYRNPPSNFIQNANDPPWTSTFPQVLHHSDFPADFVTQTMPFRPQHSAKLLMSDESISYEEMVEYRRSNRMIMIDAIGPDLFAAGAKSDDPDIRDAVEILAEWDGAANHDSRGAALFSYWINMIGGVRAVYAEEIFREKWDPQRPFDTPKGLADIEGAVAALGRAAKTLKQLFGQIDVPWGDVVRIRYAGIDLPTNAGIGPFGAFRVGFPARDDSGKLNIVGGESFVAAVEFGDRVRARGLLAPGNNDDPADLSVGKQLELFSVGDFRDIWFYRDDVDAHTVRRISLDYELR